MRDLLKNAVAVGCSVGIGEKRTRGGICIGFAEKYIPRNGFDHKHAGVYIDFATAIVKPSDGGPNVLVSLNLGSVREIADINIRLGDLPETPFWEGDTIVFTHDHNRGCGKEAHWVITKIGYDSLIEELGWSNKKILASCVLRSCEDGRTAVTHDMSNLTLIARGNLWKMKHGEPMEFASIEDEAKFYRSLGMSRNITANGNEVRMEVAINALLAGEADQLKVKVSTGKGGKDFFFALIKYESEEFGRRMRAHELKRLGFTEEATEL